MIKSFEVSNILSYNKKTYIDFRTSTEKSNMKNVIVNKSGNKLALKYISIYGPNGSGKTNIIKAMQFGIKLIKSFKVNESKGDMKCKNSNSNVSFFKYEFNMEDIDAVLEFEYDLIKREFINEKLFYVNSFGDEKLIYEFKTTDGVAILEMENLLKKVMKKKNTKLSID